MRERVVWWESGGGARGLRFGVALFGREERLTSPTAIFYIPPDMAG